jgi:hypothetical protein
MYPARKLRFPSTDEELKAGERAILDDLDKKAPLIKKWRDSVRPENEEKDSKKSPKK